MRRVSFTLGRHNKDESNIQKVSYFYAFTDDKETQQQVAEAAPVKRTYKELLDTASDIVTAFNYTPQDSTMALMTTSGDTISSSTSGEGTLSWGLTTQGSSWDTLTVLRREVWEEQGQIKGEKYFSPVVINKLTQGGGFIDYNVSNHRTYQYIFYPFLNAEAEEGKVGWSYSSVVSTKWDCWSLTELHPTDDKYTFEADAEDVWLFKYNLTPSMQKHNFSKTEQKNLSAYPKFSLGTQNNMSGDVSCLLGREFISQNLLTQRRKITVEQLYSIDENLIYWTSTGFLPSRPQVSAAPNLGVYSFGSNQVIFWCAKNKQGEPQDIDSSDVEGALKTLLFNYYGSIQYYKDEDEMVVSSMFNSDNKFIARTFASTDTTALKVAWSRERALMNKFYFWSVALPSGTSTIPTLTPLASLYYATPGYQLGEPRGDASDNQYGVYLKRYISDSGNTVEELVFWFNQSYRVHKNSTTTTRLSSADTVQYFLAGRTSEQTIPFTANGYFQNSNLRNILQNSSEDIVYLDSRPTTGQDWIDAYNSLLPDERTYAHFYGFYLSDSIPGTNGKMERLQLHLDGTALPQEQGGYIEKLPFTEQLTSNESVDMLEAWRKICYSGNPKLLKDNKGQKFLVQITSSSNTPALSTTRHIPDKIDFSWVEIGPTNNITVTGKRMEV